MNISQRNRLINTAVCLLENTDDNNVVHLGVKQFKFDMHVFSYDQDGDQEIDRPCQIHSCGTSCCVVGLGAAMYPERISRDLSWSDVSLALYGINASYLSENDDPDSPVYDKEIWEFLFSFKNPSNPIDVANRIIHILNGGKFDEAYYLGNNGLELVNKLKSMLV